MNILIGIGICVIWALICYLLRKSSESDDTDLCDAYDDYSGWDESDFSTDEYNHASTIS